MRYRQHGTFWRLIFESGIFEPPEGQALYFTKPIDYLAAAFLDSGLEKKDVEDAIARLVACESVQSQFVRKNY